MCPFPGPLIFAPSQGVSDRVRTGSQGSALPVILSCHRAPSPLHTVHGIMLPDPAELLPFLFLVSGLFFSFLPPYSLQGGLGSLLLFFVSCHFESHVTQCQLRGRDYSSPGWPGGSLRVGNHRALVVQLHHDHWGKIGLGMSACLSSTLLWPPYRWRGDGSSPTSTVSTSIHKHAGQPLAPTSAPFGQPPCRSSSNSNSSQCPVW